MEKYGQTFCEKDGIYARINFEGAGYTHIHDLFRGGRMKGCNNDKVIVWARSALKFWKIHDFMGIRSLSSPPPFVFVLEEDIKRRTQVNYMGDIGKYRDNLWNNLFVHRTKCRTINYGPFINRKRTKDTKKRRRKELLLSFNAKLS